MYLFHDDGVESENLIAEFNVRFSIQEHTQVREAGTVDSTLNDINYEEFLDKELPQITVFDDSDLLFIDNNVDSFIEFLNEN